MSQDQSNKLKAFFNQVKSIKIGRENTPPKFQIGDYIVNTKYKIVSKILEVRNVFENEDRSVNYEVAEYVLQDVKNEARDKFMSQLMGARLTTQDSRGMQKVPKRYKLAHSIDSTYHKMNPDVARALYGSIVTNGENND